MSDTVHLLISHAGCASPGCLAVLPTLQTPSLQRLLIDLTPGPIERLSDEAFDTPDERVAARALGLPALDGRSPWAALQARRMRLPLQDAAWAWLTPCHFDIGMNEVRLSQAAGLHLPDDQAQALTASMAPYFAEDRITLHPFADGRWLAHGEVFRDLVTASPARVVGEDLNPWLPASPLLRRLLNEMQMLFYTHPVNTAREAQGLAPVNALWISGAGALPAGASADVSPLSVERVLAGSACQEDWQTWAKDWQAIVDPQCAKLASGLLARQQVRLTLCGPRAFQTWNGAPRSALSRLARLWRKPQVADVLGAL